MSTGVHELAEALERVAAAMEAESAAVRAGDRHALAEAAERKRVVIEAALPALQRAEGAPRAAGARRDRLAQAAQRLETSAQRNAATLQGALDGARRLFACLTEAAQQASSTGTYGPDGSRRRAAEPVGTIHRSV